MQEKNILRSLIGLILLLVIMVSGCQSATPHEQNTQEEPAVSANPTEKVMSVVSGTSGSFFAIHEIGLGQDGYISLTNFTNVPVSTAGLIMCQGTDCFNLPGVDVPAGETVLVTVGDGEDLESVIATGATIGELDPLDGEIAIFASQDYNDPDAILVYLQWGSTPHALTSIAVDSGLWIESSYAPTSTDATRLYRLEESGWWLFEE